MRKTVLFLLLILGIGIFIPAHAEDYCALAKKKDCYVNPMSFCDEIKAKCRAQSNTIIIQNNTTIIQSNTPQDTIDYSNTYEFKVATCLNNFANEYKKFKKQYDNALVEENYKDALMYIEGMQKYIVDMKSSVCYNTEKSQITEIYNSLSEIYKAISKSIDESTKPVSDIELENAITWMYNNGLTSLNTISTFMGEEYLTREQASKFFVQFGKKILGKIVDSKKAVKLGDLTKADSTLQSYIKEANQLGLFKGVNGNFLPFNKLTRAQAIAVIIRANNGFQDETKNQWYKKYYDIVNNYGMLEGLGFDINNLDSSNIKRKEVALLLYRLNNYILSDDSSIKLCQKANGEFATSDGSTIIVDGVESYNCTCKEGYSYDGTSNKCVTENEIGNQSCQQYFGTYSYSSGTVNKNGQYSCFCKEGYGMNEDENQCITATEICKNSYGIYSYWDDEYMDDGGFSCSCQEGYDRENDKQEAKCIKK